MKIMKTFAKLSLLALAGFGLCACGLNQPNPNGGNAGKKGWADNAPSVEPYKPTPKSSEPDDGYVEPTPVEEEFPTYRLPPEKTDPEEKPNVQPDLWAGFTPADPQIAEPVTVYEPYTVICDIVLSSFQMELTPENCALLEQYGWVEEEETDVWFGGCAVYFNYDTTDYLLPVINYYVNSSGYLPNYLTPLGDAELTTMQGDDVGELYLATPNAEVIVRMIDYINSAGEIHIEFLGAYYEWWVA